MPRCYSLLLVMLLCWWTSPAMAQSYVSTLSDTTLVRLVRQYIASHRTQTRDTDVLSPKEAVIILRYEGYTYDRFDCMIAATRYRTTLERGLPATVCQVDGYWVLVYANYILQQMVMYPPGYRRFIDKTIWPLLRDQPERRPTYVPEWLRDSIPSSVPEWARRYVFERFNTWNVLFRRYKAPEIRIGV